MGSSFDGSLDSARIGGPIGERLLPHVVDAHAKFDPERVWASIARSADLSQGFWDVKFREVAQAVNNLAWYIDDQIGPGKDFETIALVGVFDIQYALFLFASIKCGYKLLLPSLRNSLVGQLSLLEGTKCNKLFYCSERESLANQLKSEKPDLGLFVVPSLAEIFAGHAPHYPYEKTFSQAQRDPILVFQTSGSTGIPKPIVTTNGFYAITDNQHKIPLLEGRRTIGYSTYQFNGGGRFYCAFPPFHGMGIGATAVIPVLYDSTVVLGPVDKPLSGELAFQMMKQPGMRAILCPPSILEEMLLEPECLETASRLDFIMNAGGPLATYAGDTLSKAVDLYQLMGSTEAGTQPHLVPRRGDWRYFEWHPIYECKMDPVEEGVYELVVPRKPDLEWIQGPFQTFPEIMEWRTRDLFKQHPTRPNLWQFYGRSDDTIVLSNGEKFNPVEMESEILGHPAISGALVAGQGRMQTALILEPQDDTADREALANEIWPLVQTANSHAPAHARVFRSRIIIAPPGKRFVRAPKGTMIRRQTENLFTPEIDALDSDGSIATPSEVPASDSQHGPIEFIRRSVAACLGRDSVGDDEDILVGGIDSIQTMELAKTLRAGLKAYGEGLQLPPVTSKMIYTNPTVRGLSTWVGSYLHPGMTSKDERGGEEAKRVARMEALVKKYTDDLPRRTLRSKKRGSDRLTVVLTGSTGSLGTYILQALLKDPAVEKIYGLNRAANARERHQKDFTARGEDHDFSSPQAEFLMANFDDPHFGLSGEKYGEVLARTDVVIHNAWKVNFNHSLESFEATHIRGVRHFIDLALASDRDPHLFFVSSIGTVGNWTVHHSGEPTPETHVDDYRIAKALGYGESKFVAERILAIAAERSGVLSSILRSGQIAGPVASDRGQWNLAEWLPSLIKTSKSLGRVPDTIGYFTDVDWIPVDVLSQIVLDLVHSDYSSREGHVFNLVNPQTVKWTTLVPTVQRHLGVEPVSFAAWIDLLRKSDAQDPTELEAKPALKILDWFVDAEQVGAAPQLLQTFETRNGVALSPTMADLTAVTPEMMQTWLNQWKY